MSLRKTRRLLIAIMCLVMLIPTVTASASEDRTKIDVVDQDEKLIKSIVFTIGVDRYFVNNETPGIKMDTAPFIEQGRTFVPVRFLGNALGVTDENIKWNPANARVTLNYGGIVAYMNIGKNKIYSNGKATTMDVVPQIKPPGRTFLPARYVAEALGYNVDWQDGRFVVVWPKDQPKPDVTPAKEYVKEMEQAKDTNGYIVPENTDLDIEIPEDIDLSVLVRLYKPVEPQYEDLTNILASKFDRKIVDEVIAYTKKKTERNDPLPLKKWQAKGHTIEAGSKAGSFTVNVRVR